MTNTTKVCNLMQSRLKSRRCRTVEVFLRRPTRIDEKNLAKQFKDPATRDAIVKTRSAFEAIDFNAEAIETAIHSVTDELGIGQGKLNQPIRAAVTGVGIGAGIYETLELIGKETTLERLDEFLAKY